MPLSCLAACAPCHESVSSSPAPTSPRCAPLSWHHSGVRFPLSPSPAPLAHARRHIGLYLRYFQTRLLHNSSSRATFCSSARSASLRRYSVSLFSCLPACLPVVLSFCPSLCLSVRPSAWFSACLSVCHLLTRPARCHVGCRPSRQDTSTQTLLLGARARLVLRPIPPEQPPRDCQSLGRRWAGQQGSGMRIPFPGLPRCRLYFRCCLLPGEDRPQAWRASSFGCGGPRPC